MHVSRWLVVGALLAATAGRAVAQEAAQEDSLGARIWLDRGDQAVLNRGDRVRIYYQASTDAYVAIFHIDTDGAVQLLYPRAPDIDAFVQGQKDYQLLFPRSAYWYVDEYPGTGYYFIVASPEPFDFSDFGYSPYERGWDLTRVGRTVYRDPYTAMDDYVAHLIPDWRTANYALDFLTYYVGEVEPYPRFLCYDCHEFRSYADWNPYTYACSSFRLVIWDDPYFSPRDRYDGSRVVYARPAFGRPRYQFKERGRDEPWSPLIRRRAPPPRHPVQFVEPSVAPRPRIASPPVRRAVPRSAAPQGSTPRPVLRGESGVSPSGRSALGRPVPSTRTVVPPTTARPETPRAGVVAPGRGSVGDRPVLQRRAPVPMERSRPSDVARPSIRPGAIPSGNSGVERPRTSGWPSVSPGRSGSIERRVPEPARPQTVRPQTPRQEPVRPQAVRPGGGRPEVRPTPSRGSAPVTRERPVIRPRSGGGGGGPPRRSSPGRRRGGGG